MKLIELSNSDRYAIVDDEDYDRIIKMGLIWRLKNSGGVITNFRLSPTKRIALLLHRLVMNLTPEDKIEVDHIDRNGLNNQKSNLRLAKHWQNNVNKTHYKNKFGYRGVDKVSTQDRYRAVVFVDGVRIRSMYSYATIEEAALAYNELAVKYHGEFAMLNKV